MVHRLALEKAQAVFRSLRTPGAGGVVLAADTSVVVGGEVLGKPAGEEDAERMLRRLAGRRHEVMTGVCVKRLDQDRTAGGVDCTGVWFRAAGESLIGAYARCGEPLDKAGAYAVQGKGAILVEKLEGSWSNVVGLPLERLPAWFEELDLRLEDFVHWAHGTDDAPRG